MDALHKLILDPNHPGNQEWYDLYNSSGDLTTRLNKIHFKLRTLKFPLLYPKRLKGDLQQLELEILNWVPDFDNWWQHARTFTERPGIYITTADDFPEDKTIGFFHYTSIIANRITLLEMQLNNLIRDTQLFKLLLEGKKSQFWATTYFTISIVITITLSIISIWVSLK